MRRAALIGGGGVAIAALCLVGLLVAEGLLFDGRPEFSEEWAGCATDDACVAVSVPCGWTAVNRRHRESAEAFYAYIATVIDLRCTGDAMPPDPPPASCRAGRCALD